MIEPLSVVPEVTVVDGMVVIDGQPALALTMTAYVAQELAEQLASAAVVAIGHCAALGVEQRSHEPPVMRAVCAASRYTE